MGRPRFQLGYSGHRRRHGLAGGALPVSRPGDLVGPGRGRNPQGPGTRQEPGLLRCATKGLSRQVCPRFTRSASPGRRVCVCPSHCCSAAQLCPARRPPWPAARRASLCCTASQNLLRLMSMGSVTPSNHLVVPFSCLQSFPASGSFPVSQFFASRGQNIGASVSASVLPMSI